MGGLDILERALRAVKDGIVFLAFSRLANRRVGHCSYIRELFSPVEPAGYVVVVEIEDSNAVIIVVIHY